MVADDNTTSTNFQDPPALLKGIGGIIDLDTIKIATDGILTDNSSSDGSIALHSD